MKRNVSFVTVVIILLIVEIYCHEKSHPDLFWTNNLRIISLIIMAIWYFVQQKNDTSHIKNAFFVSTLLPIFVSLTSYNVIEKYAIIINIFINISILSIWIYCFRKKGAIIKLQDSNRTLTKLIPAYFILPIFFYYFVLHDSLSMVYALCVLLYILVFSYTGILSAFLPINEEKKLCIIIGIALLVIINFMNAYHTFLQKIVLGYPIIRIITIIARMMIIFGMIDSDREKEDKRFVQL